MELSEVVNPHYAFPVGLVLICAVLVFAFGFKSAEQPAFAQLTYTGDDRKPSGKKRKIKDKQKSQHTGQGTTSNEEQADIKAATKNDTEKELSSKPTTKQDKQKRQEASPVKEQKNINKDAIKVTSGKPQKENRESITKPLKEKKQESSEKSPVKDNNKLVTKQTKVKTNESKGEDIKNKKNERNLAKLKAEEKPTDFDDGEWEQALSRKDKKNRKKDDPLLIDEGVESAGKENKSPLKKKKSNAKVDDSVKLEITVDEIKIVEDAVEKTLFEKQPQKDNKEEEKRKSKKPVKEVVDDEKILEEVGNTVDGGSKLKKKLKKKAGSKSAEPEAIEVVEVQEVVVKEKKQDELKEKENPPAVTETKSEPKRESESGVVFDELGDVWKEAKAQKKAKKKVRKDQ